VNANQGSNMCQFLSLWLDSTGSRTPDLPHSVGVVNRKMIGGF